MNDSGKQTRWLVALIMLTLVGWGLFHAIGATFGARPAGPNIFRGLIVLACSVGFLLFWIVALLLRARRLRRQKQDRDGERHPPR